MNYFIHDMTENEGNLQLCYPELITLSKGYLRPMQCPQHRQLMK